ncbi:ABC transporter permease [Ligilactobacillus murinus]|jgi:peptide/nickel transport system permease protein|uniref:ABC transporter permease n=1 Tax=Ligilactobacillus murinus TaxID=1622 RepID=A0A4S2ED83_9LACO|nr:ABC transporter permease [Ligilactobacillus murinus]HBV48985.1 peptide ABC transporter permease [Lactobacillus sp.]MBX9012784.1 ABC transporter permease [Ligilactobacillus murinus]MCR1880023.1 ABC transporter permease [Ligilactobacillus murinus]MDO4457246.1 ABC transporter permease [Ligilactobacillus murinus]NEF82576.1 ABC transporter permease [Ligilactobacillus murinus]
MKKNTSNFAMIVREFKQDKGATFFLFLLLTLILFIYVYAAFLNTKQVMHVDIINSYGHPGKDGHLLGTDQGGRDVLKYLVLGTRNSLDIGLAVTLIVEVIGIVFGLVAGYYGGLVDNIMMRFLDFMMLLPMLMLVIVIVSIIPNYSMLDFVLVVSAFLWVGTARLIRSKTLAEAQKEYVYVAMTSGSSAWKIMLTDILPNISSLIIVDLILSLTANIGIEVGLSFLGFGLPESVPSLGLMIGLAQDPDVMIGAPWVWIPASLLILVLCVGISYVGNVIRRAFDARQRLG